MKKVLLASVAALAFAGAAQAADLPSKRSAVVAYAPASIWTGFYAGVHAGWTGGEFKTTDVASGLRQTQKDNSFSGGALVGYNYQIQQFVLGAEADITAYNLKKAKLGALAANLETSSNWLATVRGRVGYAVDRFLPFVTAGVAFTDSKQAYALASESKTRTGYALGAGVDYAFTNNIIGRVEYQYAKFDGTKFNFVGDKADLTLNQVRAAVSYKF